MDIDFLMLEYNNAKPTALVEYKREHNQKIDLAHPTYRAISELANRSQIPFFVVVYDGSWNFTIWTVNDIAISKCIAGQRMSELEYVTFLYSLRNLTLPKEVKEKLVGETAEAVNVGDFI